jgi:hypothetical protein
MGQNNCTNATGRRQFFTLRSDSGSVRTEIPKQAIGSTDSGLVVNIEDTEKKSSNIAQDKEKGNDLPSHDISGSNELSDNEITEGVRIALLPHQHTLFCERKV